MAFNWLAGLLGGPLTGGYVGFKQKQQQEDYNGVQGLRDLSNNLFGGALKGEQEAFGPINKAFMDQTLKPGAMYDSALTAAKGVGSQLFAPGGEVDAMIAKARGNSIQSGFSPQSAGYNEGAVLRSATGRIADTFAQSAAQLEGQRYSALTSAYGEGKSNIRDLMESVFTGQATAEQLRLAQPKKKFLGLF